MKTRTLGQSDLEISVLGMGAWAIGGQWEWGWGLQDEKDSIEAVHAAVDAGINWVDTAPVYGLGNSESVIGKAMSLLPASKKPLIFTKCGFNWDDAGKITPSMKRDSVRNEVENSLKRLGVETIDLYQMHWPDPDPDIEEGFETIHALIREGKIRYAGVSNFSVEQMDRVKTYGTITSLQPKYNALHRDIEEDVLPYCRDQDIGVIAYSPMASGLLTGKMTRERIAQLPDDDWRKRSDDFCEPALTKNLRVVEAMRNLAEQHQCRIADIALAFTLNHPALTGAIVGLRQASQVEGVLGGASVTLTADDLETLNEVLA